MTGSSALCAHWPAFGVNVRLAFPPDWLGLNSLLTTPGPDQLPAMPSTTVGNGTGGSVSQSGPIGEGFGSISSSTVMFMVASTAQKLGSGEKVMVVVVLPRPAGLNVGPTSQEPVMPSNDVVGRFTGGSDSHRGPMGVKVGVPPGEPFTVMLSMV